MGSSSASCETADIVITTIKLSRTIATAKFDFFLLCSSEGEDFGLLCVEVKKPSCVTTQSLNVCLRIALEMKSSVDNQDLNGI